MEPMTDVIVRPNMPRPPIQWRGGSLPWPFWACLAAVFVGWFPCDILSTTVGALRLHFNFFNLASLIAQPTRLITGLNRGDVLTIPFGVLCLAALAATLAPRLSTHPIARFGPCVPLALMLVCFAIFYAVTSGDTFVADPNAGHLSTAITHFGNVLANHASAMVASHISVGLGVWLSVPGVLYLAHGAMRGKWLPSNLPAPTPAQRALAR
jgi:hypothetical protein